jgi:tRNA-dihydrouridine synthase
MQKCSNVREHKSLLVTVVRESNEATTVFVPFQSIHTQRLMNIQGLADWEKIRAVKEAVSVPVFANGNVLFHSDIEVCLRATGADAVMSAEGQLYNAALFVSSLPSHPFSSSSTFETGFHPPHADLALEYLSIAKELKTKPSPSAIKGHLFKLMRPGLERETDLREQLGKTNGSIDACIKLVEEMKFRMEVRFASLNLRCWVIDESLARC